MKSAISFRSCYAKFVQFILTIWQASSSPLIQKQLDPSEIGLISLGVSSPPLAALKVYLCMYERKRVHT